MTIGGVDRRDDGEILSAVRPFDRNRILAASAITRLDLDPFGFNPATPSLQVGHDMGLVEIHYLLETFRERRSRYPSLAIDHQEVEETFFLAPGATNEFLEQRHLRR